jgi:hypothetical protein
MIREEVQAPEPVLSDKSEGTQPKDTANHELDKVIGEVFKRMSPDCSRKSPSERLGSALSFQKKTRADMTGCFALRSEPTSQRGKLLLSQRSFPKANVVMAKTKTLLSEEN